MGEAVVILPGEEHYDTYYKAWQAGKGEEIRAHGYIWMVVHEDTYVKFVRKAPIGGFDNYYSQQSWPQPEREVKRGPFD